METYKIKQLLQRFFEGNTTFEEERMLEDYFHSENIDKELKHYKIFFAGVSELSKPLDSSGLEDDIMDHILEAEHNEKKRYRWMWQTISGVAASILIILGGLLIYEQNQTPFQDTFEDPEIAYAYAENTLKYMASIYKTGVEPLSGVRSYQAGLKPLGKFKTINEAPKPLQSSVNKVNKGFEEIRNINTTIKN